MTVSKKPRHQRIIEELSDEIETPMTAELRDAIIRTVIGSQALEGVELTYEEVARLFDEVMSEPLINLD